MTQVRICLGLLRELFQINHTQKNFEICRSKLATFCDLVFKNCPSVEGRMILILENERGRMIKFLENERCRMILFLEN